MNWVQWFTFVIGLLPQVLQLVIQVEQVLGPTTGTEKKQSVLDSVTAQAVALGATPDQVSQAQVMASGLIDSHVETLNKTGIFKRSDAGVRPKPKSDEVKP